MPLIHGIDAPRVFTPSIFEGWRLPAESVVPAHQMKIETKVKGKAIFFYLRPVGRVGWPHRTLQRLFAAINNKRHSDMIVRLKPGLGFDNLERSQARIVFEGRLVKPPVRQSKLK